MGNIIGFVLIPFLLYVAVPVGIIALVIWCTSDLRIPPLMRWFQVAWICTVGIWLYFLFLPRLMDWLWFMAFGGGWAGR